MQVFIRVLNAIIIGLQVEMSHQISNEDIKMAVEASQSLQKLSKTTLCQFCGVFKIQFSGCSNEALIKLFKNKIIDIFLQERELYKDYLKLPKFASLSDQASNTIVRIFQQLWQEIRGFKEKEIFRQTQKRVQELMPKSQSTKQAASFHLDLLELYENASFCPINAQKQTNKQTKTKQRRKQNQQNHQANGQERSENVGQVGSSGLPINDDNLQQQKREVVPKVQTEQVYPIHLVGNMPNLMVSGMPQLVAQGMSYQMMPQGMQHYIPAGIPIINPAMTQMNGYQINSHLQQNYMMAGHYMIQNQKGPLQVYLPNHFSADPGSFTNSFKFIFCACHGKSSTQKAHFTCQRCQHSYHFQCLGLKQAMVVKICPFCILKQNNLFCTVEQQPITYVWHQYRNQDLRLQISNEQSKMIHKKTEQGLTSQLRFIKVQSQPVIINPVESRYQRRSQYITDKKSISMDLYLPEFYQQRRDPIVIQIDLKKNNPKNLNRFYFLFAIFMIKQKSIKDLLNQIIQNESMFSDVRFYQQNWPEKQPSIHLNTIDPVTQQQILYPVRGNNCQHLKAFDYQHFLKAYQKNQDNQMTQFLCPVCKKKIDFFKLDKFLYDAIIQNNEYETTKPKGLIYDKEGLIQWQCSEQNQKQKKRKFSQEYFFEQGGDGCERSEENNKITEKQND